jgi:uncharacterized membrane protein YhiD involved in acid resistance
MRQRITNKRLWLLVSCIIATALLLNLPHQAIAEPEPVEQTPTPNGVFGFDADVASSVDEVTAIDWTGFWRTLAEIAPVMLLAALLGGLIAYRRRVTVFEHNLFHTHILLSVAGALMMLIVADQLPRAFGLLGAASVVRYRYRLRNPRDASMLIISLGVGMATGVRLYAHAVSAAIVVFAFSRGLDYFTTRSNLILVVTQPTRLRIRTLQPEETLTKIARTFAERGIRHQLRRYRRTRKRSVDGAPIFLLDYNVQLGTDDDRDQLTAEMTEASLVSVRWNTEKPKKV